MRRLSICVLAAAVALATVGTGMALSAAGEKPITVRAGNVLLTVNGNASPTRLPKHGLFPVSFHANGRIATTDGSHPPALEEVILDVGKAGTVEAQDFPACSAGKLEATTTEAAEQTCRSAIVGRGTAEVEVAFPEQHPFTASGPLVLFNGGRHGNEALLLIHAYIDVPAPTAVVTSSVTTPEHKGPYRLRSVTKIPPVAGGAGSLTAFSLKITRRGYLTANCDNGHFSAHVEAKFHHGPVIEGSFTRPCTGIE